MKDELSCGKGQEEGSGTGHGALGTWQLPSWELLPYGSARTLLEHSWVPAPGDPVAGTTRRQAALSCGRPTAPGPRKTHGQEPKLGAAASQHPCSPGLGDTTAGQPPPASPFLPSLPQDLPQTLLPASAWAPCCPPAQGCHTGPVSLRHPCGAVQPSPGQGRAQRRGSWGRAMHLSPTPGWDTEAAVLHPNVEPRGWSHSRGRDGKVGLALVGLVQHTGSQVRQAVWCGEGQHWAGTRES